MSEFLSLEQVADLLGIHRDTVRNAIAAKKLKAVRAGRQIRVRRVDLDSWLQSVN